MPVFLGIVAALIHSMVFYPGMVAWDMRVQIDEALAGCAGDVHPPVVAAILHLFFLSGLTVGRVFIIQEILFWTGLSVFLDSLLQLGFFRPLKSSARHGILAVLLVLYLMPLTPYNFYAATLLKDSWLVIAILWGLHHFLVMAGIPGNDGTVRTGTLRMFTMSGCFACAALFRHNAVLLLPGACAAGVFCMWNRRYSWAWALLPLLLYAGIQTGAAATIRIHKNNWNRFYYALELISYEAINPPADSEHRFVTPFLKPGFKQHFSFGGLGVTPWVENEIVRQELFDDANAGAITQEYFSLLRRHPLLMTRVKLNAFAALLGLDWSWSVLAGNYSNNPELAASHSSPPRFATSLMTFYERIAYKKIYRPAVLGHLPWAVMNLLMASGVIALLRSRKLSPASGFFLLLFLSFPLAYYLSYLIFAPSADYRYMMPSTLLIQAAALVFAVRCTLPFKNDTGCHK